jgi:hypothetical protein
LAARQKKKKMPLSKIVTEFSTIINSYPIRHIARMEAMRLNEEENQQRQFEDSKIVLTETFC